MGRRSASWFLAAAAAVAAALPAAAAAGKPKPVMGGKVWLGEVSTGTYSNQGTGNLCHSPFSEQTAGLRLVTTSTQPLNLTFRYYETPPAPAHATATGTWSMHQELQSFCVGDPPNQPATCNGTVHTGPNGFGLVGTLAHTIAGSVLFRVVGPSVGEQLPASGPCSSWERMSDYVGFGATYALWSVVQAKFPLVRVRRWLVARRPAPLVAAAQQWKPPDPGSPTCWSAGGITCTGAVTAHATIVVSRTPLPATWADSYH